MLMVIRMLFVKKIFESMSQIIKMSFLPPTPFKVLFSGGRAGRGGIAVNHDGSLLASLDTYNHSVYICSMDSSVVVGANNGLHFPSAVCFANRNGKETLFVGDSGHSRMHEIAIDGSVLRNAPMRNGWIGSISGIAYCSLNDSIAVSFYNNHCLELLQYESLETTVRMQNVEQLIFPKDVMFTVCGKYIMVAGDESRVSSFSTADGTFVTHVTLDIRNPITGVMVVQHPDGFIVSAGICEKIIYFVGHNGLNKKEIIRFGFSPVDITYSAARGVLIVKVFEKVMVLEDAWMESSKGSWLSVCCT